MNIIGVSAFFHDAACCLLQNGILKYAAEEERFTRRKADASAPIHAMKYCLREAGLSITDIDCLAYYEDPSKKLARQIWSGILGHPGELLGSVSPGHVETQIREVLGYQGQIKYVDHHLSHSASSFYFSGFRESAVFTVDGVGEWATTTYGVGNAKGVKIFEEVDFPDSLGLLYSTITSYLGFGVNDGEYKVMGLAPYGAPGYVKQMRRLVQMEAGGKYKLDMRYFDFLAGICMYSPELAELFGRPPRMEDAEMEQFHMDIAKSLQVVLEEILLEKARYLHDCTGMENLCMAGGVALNCVANGKVLKHGPFKQLFVQPAANDAGGCMGAAAYAYVDLTGESMPVEKMKHVYLGPAYTNNDIKKFLAPTNIIYTDCTGDPDRLCTLTAEKIKEGKVIGWFQGRMEFGPRSLGARSILADPRHPSMRERINAMVKKREGFRPFAPAVIEHRAAEYFDLDHPSPFMLETCQMIADVSLPAITHVDGSARVQTVNPHTNPRFYALLEAFDRITGCPILLNTSFNIKGEPIVCNIEDAMKCFITTDIDCLVIGDFIISREENSLELLQFLLMHERSIYSTLNHNVYTFV
ncbi:carbamoyltransferase [Chitinophaga costaii]|uniref:Carbamoyltransferase n=1 Tax=Chitinophaga costaii TaxID=1335309 RepID=A0A1C3YTN7_9BACT|nr:carbamoyltransferase [Chitinophaga costaii]PUZ30101.1 carbamoyltransferase [Chitinophaga costaii]SCB73419.1 carbamoyltransferase [Chitinophaga costaii]